jgi:hypothetical protein
LGSGVFFGSPGYAQNKTACELLSKADAEGVLRVTLRPPKLTAPFRSLLDPDFSKGTVDQGSSFTNCAPNQPKAPKVIAAAIIALSPLSGDANNGSVGSPDLPNQVIPDKVGQRFPDQHCSNPDGSGRYCQY